MMSFLYKMRKLCRIESRKMRWLMVVGVMAFTHLLFQSLLLPYENAIKSLLPGGEVGNHGNYSLPIIHSSEKGMVVRNPLAINASEVTDTSVILEDENEEEDLGAEDIEHDGALGEEEREILSEVKDLLSLAEVKDLGIEDADGDINNGFPSEHLVDKVQSLLTDGIETVENSSVLKLGSEDGLPNTQPHLAASTENNQEKDPNETTKILEDVDSSSQSQPSESSMAASLKNAAHLKGVVSNGNGTAVNPFAAQSGLTVSNNNSAITSKPSKKKMKSETPPTSVTSIEEMNRIVERRRSRAMRPRWSSARDQEILTAKFQIEHTRPAVIDLDLYAPVFRNVSKFVRSYELMERTLKIYVYKEGKKPVFHTPILKGLYASEGWFMKLMEGNRRFAVKDPRRAHLFYMPFSSRMLQYTIYVPNSHNRTNLRQYLKDYTDKISAKYPYFNRTGGADHFLVACHDWAPYETRHHMEHCIKALCNADVTVGFKIGRDVSLPETYVRSQRNPLRSLGGLPPSRRHVLAFYAGGMHGYLRPILVKQWKDKDPSMKIFGQMPAGVASKLNYIQHMKSSKYCLCPRGYEVNSPRVVEAIFYECVPVIISDNFVPPFFDILNWDAFSIIIPEKDIPNLKDILQSIPEKKYLEMQLAVRKVQRHFLWHAKPLKYDLFYMALHSIWHSRVYQTKAR